MINVFIFILMENLQDNYINEDNIITLYNDLADSFKEKWIEFCDKNEIMYICEKFVILNQENNRFIYGCSVSFGTLLKAKYR